MLFDLIEPVSLLIGLSIGFCCGFLYFNKNKSPEFHLKKGKNENGGETREEVCIFVIMFSCPQFCAFNVLEKCLLYGTCTPKGSHLRPC